MENKLDTLGWATPPENVMENYINKCKLFVEDDNAFNKFRQDEDYKIILEGWNEGGNTWLGEILYNYGDDILLEKLNLFKRNDVYGSPTIRNYSIVGDMCPFTLKYIRDGLNIKQKTKDYKFKKIIEVGVGFGSMCIIMDSLYEFEEYVLVDLPEVVKLTEKYLKHFPEIYNKVRFIECNDTSSFDKIENFDLFISDSALAECDFPTQKLYIDKLASKCNFAYIVYNSIGNPIGNSNYSLFFNEIDPIFDIDSDESNGIKYMCLKKK